MFKKVVVEEQWQENGRLRACIYSVKINSSDLLFTAPMESCNCLKIKTLVLIFFPALQTQH